MQPRVRKTLVGILKFGISFGILGYLIFQAIRDDDLSLLLAVEKNYVWLAVGALFSMLAVFNTFTRWWILVRALDLDLPFRESMKLSAIGYALKFITVGVVGGDLVKAIFVARRQQTRKAEAAATVVIDRVFGLYALFVVTAIASLFLDFGKLNGDPASVQALEITIYVARGLAIIGTVGIFLLLALANQTFWDHFAKVPKIGGILMQLVGAMRLYRTKLNVIFLTLGMSFLTHVLYSISVYFLAIGLHPDAPGVFSHLVMMPLCLLANALPLPGGLGAMEAVLNFFYQAVGVAALPKSQGLFTCLAFRLVEFAIAIVGVIFYMVDRKEVDEILETGEDAEPKNEKPLANIATK